VQLIDATNWYQSLRKNLGKNNCELNEDNIKAISDLIVTPKQTEQSKVFENAEFGYYKIIVERPLRLSITLSNDNLRSFKKLCQENKETALYTVIEALAKEIGSDPQNNYNEFLALFEAKAEEMSVKVSAKNKKLIQDNLAIVDETAEPVIKKIHSTSKTKPDAINGLFAHKLNGKSVIVEYEPDANLRDSEQVPLLEEGGITAFMQREVLPYTPDAWVDQSKTQIGYEISFTKHFYKPVPMRTLEEIKADIFAIEQETEGLLHEIVGDAK
jgi:type I restriction enzyme M protein